MSHLIHLSSRENSCTSKERFEKEGILKNKNRIFIRYLNI